ncbi:MAG: hypothetical protein IKK41_02630 [Oscillospiraceae bacterium]|nr:hypothetical protein [Oscillospiraceae bacterium]
MAHRNNRYKEMERYMTLALIADAVLFVLYLICAGSGVVWLKVILAILTILLSGLCLAYLYLSKELLRQRSLWMTACAGAVFVCVVFSLVLNFPSPNKYKKDKAPETSYSAVIETVDFY